MNIFYLSHDVKECARWHVDRHVVKMITEIAQMLSTAHRYLDGFMVKVEYLTEKGKKRSKNVWVLDDSRADVLYQATHLNHPCNVWIRTSVSNYLWAVDLMFALGAEYKYRYGRDHATISKLGYMLASPPHGLINWDWTTPPSCMSTECIVSENPIDNYQEYYRVSKSKLHSWKNREKPEWII